MSFEPSSLRTAVVVVGLQGIVGCSCSGIVGLVVGTFVVVGFSVGLRRSCLRPLVVGQIS